MRKILQIGILFLFPTFSCQGAVVQDTSAVVETPTDHSSVNYNIPLSKLIDSLKLRTADLNILILKKTYLLEVRKDTTVIKCYPVVFGFEPLNDKLRQGDGCTPEGIFHMRAKYPHASWSKFIWINYPTDDSWRKHNQAKRDGTIPANAQIGGEVGIHGVPEGYDYAIDQRQNWTLGCISLKTKDINEIYKFITETTVIEIRKE